MGKSIILSWLRLRLRILAGKVFNLAGVPGIVRDCDYAATARDVRVQVRAGELFTIISVNDLDIYFHRLTGGIDGFGAPPNFQPDEAQRSEQFPELPVFSRHNSQKQTR